MSKDYMLRTVLLGSTAISLLATSPALSSEDVTFDIILGGASSAGSCSPAPGQTGSATAKCGPGNFNSTIKYSPNGPTFKLDLTGVSVASSASDAVFINPFTATGTSGSTRVSVNASNDSLMYGGLGSGINVDGLGSKVGTAILSGSTIVANRFDGIRVTQNILDVEVANNLTGKIYSSGAGIVVLSQSGNISIKNDGFISAGPQSVSIPGSVQTNLGSSFAYGGGISASTINGSVSIVNEGTVSTTNGAGISAWSNEKAVIVNNGSISAADIGVNATSVGIGFFDQILVSIGGSGSVSSNGKSNSGISAFVSRQDAVGDMAITSSGSVRGGQVGISAVNNGKGSIAITGVGPVEGANGNGIVATAQGGNVTVAPAASVVGTYGITARTIGSGTVSVSAAGAITGNNGTGIETVAINGATRITANGEVSGTLHGIAATATGSGSVAVDGSGMIRASQYDAIIATTNGVGSTATPLIAISGSGGASAENGLRAINAWISNSAAVGDISITRSGSAIGALGGISAENAGQGSVIVSGAGAVNGNAGAGIFAKTQGGDVTISPASSVEGTFGLQGFAVGGGSITVATAGPVAGRKQSGIQTQALNGATKITTNGMVTGISNAIDAQSVGAGAVSVAVSGGAAAKDVGILARSGAGKITIENGANSTVLASTAILASSSGGAVQVNNRGTIDRATVGVAVGAKTTAGLSNDAGGQINFGYLGLAGASGGALVMSNEGTLKQDATLPRTISATNLPQEYASVAPSAPAAIFGRTSGGDLSIANKGQVSIANGNGIDAAVLSGAGRLMIINQVGGTITATDGMAIDTTRSSVAAQVSNAGTINGRMNLNNGSSFTNTADSNGKGAFNASGTSAFGNGTLTNLGLINLGSGSALSGISAFNNQAGGIIALTGTSPATASITAGTFINAGTINLGAAAPGNTLTINGNYQGRGGTINGIFSSQSNAADRLVINGNASGTTTVNITNIGSATAFTTGVPIVTVNGTVDQGAFDLGQAKNFGTLKVQLLARSGQGINSFNLTGGTDDTTVIVTEARPNAAGEQGATANVAARTIASQGTTAILDRVTQVRQEKQSAQAGFSAPMQYAALVSKDPIAAQIVVPAAPVSNVRPAVFARAFGDFEHRSGISALGNDLGYNQSTGGLVGGADAVISGLTSAQDGVILGAFGGYTVARVQLAQGMGHQFYEGGSVGAYATYLNGGFFADTLFKADLLGLDIRSPMVRQDTGLQNYSWLGNIGYRFDVGRALYLEPTAGLEYVATNFNRNPTGTVSTVPLQDGDALRGRIGARLGTEFVENNVRYEPSITALVYDVFSETGNTATFGGVTAVTGLKNVGKIRGEVQTAMNFFNLATGWSGFLRADYRVGSDLVGAGGRAGMRYQW